MTPRKALKMIMERDGFNMDDVAYNAGLKNRSNVSESLKRDMKLSRFISLSAAVGYEVVMIRSDIARKLPNIIRLEIDEDVLDSEQTKKNRRDNIEAVKMRKTLEQED